MGLACIQCSGLVNFNKRKQLWEDCKQCGMSAAASVAAVEEAERGGVNYDKLEDPALHWVKLVDAFRTRDPAAVNRVLAVAKKSQWTGTLWKQEMDTMHTGWEEEDSDTELD